jgi:hypothetical protein
MAQFARALDAGAVVIKRQFSADIRRRHPAPLAGCSTLRALILRGRSRPIAEVAEVPETIGKT